MKRGHHYSHTLGVAVILIFVFSFCGCDAAVHAIDGCSKAKQASGSSVSISTAAPDGTNGVYVHFTDCAIPYQQHIIISVSPPAQQQQQQTVHIDLQSTTMERGSVQISGTSLVNVLLTVNNSVLDCHDNALVLKTSGGASNVVIQVYNSVVTSLHGSVVSVVDTSGGGVFDGVSILIGGGTTLKAYFLAATIQARRVRNTTLMVDSSSGCSGPVKITTGGSSISGTVGAVAVLSSSPATAAMLFLQDVYILVADTTTSDASTSSPPPFTCSTTSSTTLAPTIYITTASKKGAAITAGIGLTHKDHVELMMAGNITIDVRQTARHRHVIPSTTEPQLTLMATITNDDSASAVGGVALVTHKKDTQSKTVMIMNNCALRISFLMNNSDDNGGGGSSGVVLMKSRTGQGCATAVLGVAVNSHANTVEQPCFSTITMTNRSSLVVASSITGGKDITMSSTCSSQIDATTVLGVAMYSWSYEVPTTTFSILEQSFVSIVSSISKCRKVTMMAEATYHYAGTVLGVAALSLAEGKFLSSTSLALTESRLLVAISVSNCDVLTLSSSSTGTNYVAVSVGGVALVGYSHNKGPGHSTLTVTSSSSLSIASMITNCTKIVVESLTKGSVGSSATLGVALCSRGDGDSNADFSARNRSTVSIIFSSNRSRNLVLSSRGATYAAAAILGIASRSDGSNALRFGNSTTVTINAVLLDEEAVVASVVTASSAAASLALAIEGRTNARLQLVQEPLEDPTAWSPIETNLEVWVGVTKNLQISASTGTPVFSAALAILAKTALSGLSNKNTLLSVCSQGSIQVSASTTLRIKAPSQPGDVSFNNTNAWNPLSDEGPSLTPASKWCNDRKSQVEHDVVRAMLSADSTLWALPGWLRSHVPHDPTPTATDTKSPSIDTLSRSATLTPSSTSTDGSRTRSNQRTTTRSISLSRSNTVSAPTSASSTLTATSTLMPLRTLPPTLSPPKQRTVKITTSILLPGNEQAATVVLSTAGASTAVASTLGSGGAGTVVTAGSSVRMMECGLADDNPRPASFELPIQFAVGSGSTRYFAGASLAHTLLQCFFLAVPVLLRRSQTEGSKAVDNDNENKVSKSVTYLSMLFCGAHPFFTPAILGACSTVLNNDDDGLSLAVAGCCVLVLVGVHGAVVLAVHRGPQNGLVARVRSVDGQSLKLDFMMAHSEVSSNEDSVKEYTSFLFSGHATKDILLTLFDGCRIFEKASHRHYASIETTLYSIIAVISGARPKENCTAAVFVIGVLAIAQLLYIVVIRPFRTRLDTIFSLLNALVLVVLSLAVAVSVQKRSSEDAVPDEWVLKTVEVCLWLISVIGVGQLVVQGYWTFHVERRRQQRVAQDLLVNQSQQKQQDSSSSDSDNDSSSSGEEDPHDPKAEALLKAVEMEDRPSHLVLREQEGREGDHKNSNAIDRTTSTEITPSTTRSKNSVRNPLKDSHR